MTTEEKAKAYDEALKQAKFYHGNCPSEPERKKLEKMFPVLHESEDEKIRKALIAHFTNNCVSEGWAGLDIPKVIAWLEKQKDASKAIEAVERIDKYIDAHTANAHDMDDSNPDKKYYQGQDDALGKIAGILQDVYTEKKEQKPAKEVDNLHNYLYGDNEKSQEWSEEDEKIWLKSLPLNFKKKNEDVAKLCSNEWSEEDGETLKDIIRSVTGFDATTGIISQNFKQHEKKINFLKSLRPQSEQEWSEDDKKMLDNAIHACLDVYGTMSETADWLKTRLKSLRPQSEQEWSEEDKQALQYSIDWLSTYRDRHAMTQDAKDDITFCIEKLKTLCPQSHWKPSEKQINMLGVIVEREKEKLLYGIDGYSPAAVLESLYNDLKKLMEE